MDPTVQAKISTKQFLSFIIATDPNYLIQKLGTHGWDRVVVDKFSEHINSLSHEHTRTFNESNKIILLLIEQLKYMILNCPDETVVERTFNLIGFILNHGYLYLCSFEATQIWNFFIVEQKNSVYQDLCFSFFYKLMSEDSLDPETIEDLFSTYISTVDPKSLNQIRFWCFDIFFKAVNFHQNNIIFNNGFFYNNNTSLVGNEYIWKIIMQSPIEVANLCTTMNNRINQLASDSNSKKDENSRIFIKDCAVMLEKFYDKDNGFIDSPEASESIGRIMTSLQSYLFQLNEPIKCFVGLINSDSICYMNAILHQLFMVKNLRNIVIKFDPKVLDEKMQKKNIKDSSKKLNNAFEIISKLHEIFDELLKSEQNVSHNLYEYIGDDRFANRRIQADASEFFVYILAAMNMGLMKLDNNVFWDIV